MVFFLISQQTSIYDGILLEVERLVGYLETIQRQDGRFSNSDFEDVLVLFSVYDAEKVANPKNKIREHFLKIIRKADKNGVFDYLTNSRDPKARFKWYRFLVYTNSLTQPALKAEIEKIDWQKQNDVEFFAVVHETASMAGLKYDFLCQKIESFLEKFIQNPKIQDLERVYFISQLLNRSNCQKFNKHSPFVSEVLKGVEKLKDQLRKNPSFVCMYFDVLSNFPSYRTFSFKEFELLFDALRKVRKPKEVAICISSAVKVLLKKM
ncbi:MAG: hypothetical protein ACO2PO_14905 [Candidatus Calescibacterium sp.]